MVNKAYWLALLVSASVFLVGCASNADVEDSVSVEEKSEIPEEAVYRYGVEAVNPGRIGAAYGVPSDQHVLHFAEYYTLGMAQAEVTKEAKVAKKHAVAESHALKSSDSDDADHRTEPQEKSEKADSTDSRDEDVPSESSDSNLDGNPGYDDYEKAGSYPPK